MAKWSTSQAPSLARIERVNDDDTLAILYHDGFKEDDVRLYCNVLFYKFCTNTYRPSLCRPLASNELQKNAKTMALGNKFGVTLILNEASKSGAVALIVKSKRRSVLRGKRVFFLNFCMQIFCSNFRSENLCRGTQQQFYAV
jgi:hypothetical protein